MLTFRGFLGRMFTMPSYPPDERDLRTFRLAGLELPVRATVVVVAVILIVIFDFQRTLIPDDLVRYDRNPGDPAAPGAEPGRPVLRRAAADHRSSGSATSRAATGSSSATGAGGSGWRSPAAS